MRCLLILAISIFPNWAIWCQSVTPAEGAVMSINESFSDESLQEVLHFLEKKYILHFAYNPNTVQNVRVSCVLQNVSPEAAMDQILKGTDFQYRMVDERHVMIRADVETLSYTEASGLIAINGQVQDAVSGEALAFASVISSDGKTGVETDPSGQFRLILPEGEAAVFSVQYLGYASRTIQLGTHKSSDLLTVNLYPKATEIPGITVEEEAPLLSVDSNGTHFKIDARQLDGLPDFVGGKDLFRSLQMLPGVSASDDLSAGLQIRGGGTDENLIIIDGITLYRIDHYYGVFSAINPNVVGKVELYKNAFPAQFGGRTSGVLDMQTLPPGVAGADGGAEINLLTSNAWVQTPIGKNLDLLIGGRISNGNISDTQLFGLINQERLRNTENENPLSTLSRNAVLGQTPDFRFYDLNARLSWQLGKGSRLALNFFHSYDNFENTYENKFTNVLKRVRITNTERFSESSNWNNTGLSIQGTHQWNDQWTSSLDLSRSAFENSNQLAASLQRMAGRRDTTVGVSNHNLNSIEGYNLRVGTTWNINNQQGLKFGYEGLFHQTGFDIGIDENSLIKGEQAAWEHALYAQYHLNFAKRWTLQAGLRGNYYGPAEKLFISPRVQLRFEPAEGWALQASASRYYQFLREIDYETRFGSFQPFYVLANDQQFPVSASNHIAAGFSYLGNGFGLEVEYFDRRTSGILEYALVRTGFDANKEEPARNLNYQGFIGTGRTFGIDILLRKNSGNYTGWMAYTLSKSTNRFDEILNGTPFPSSNDRRHQLQFVNQYRAGNWLFSGTYTFASGRPYTDLADLARLKIPPTDRRELNVKDRISYLADYHRIDLSAQYDFRLGPLGAYAGVSVFNLFNRQNVKYRQYVFSIPETQRDTEDDYRSTVIGNELQMLGRTFNLKFGLTF